jgi:peptidoglycan/xylan/chitin deacetylase (PgdA/CDA1 family)
MTQFFIKSNFKPRLEKLKRYALYTAKLSGLFIIAKILTKRGLRILCYHNFSESDEYQWRPRLFIRPETFLYRIKTINKNKFNVIRLEEALLLIKKKKLPPYSLVITFDDGWYNTLKCAHPILKHYSYGYTIYVSSYYSEKELPVFNLILPYIIWKAKKEDQQIFAKLRHAFRSISDFAGNNQFVNKLIAYGQSHCDSEGRMDIIRKVGNVSNISCNKIIESRVFNYLNRVELRDLVEQNVDIQLHTHTHQLPVNPDVADYEINRNKKYLEAVVGKPLKHFCYPSGRWNECHFAIFRDNEIESATTCEPGFVYNAKKPFNVCRFLDSEAIPQIVFEAELSGFLELFRRLRRILMIE